MMTLRFVLGMLICAGACAGEPLPAGQPGEDELAIWAMMNEHRRDRPVWDNMVAGLIRVKHVAGSERTWNQVVRIRIDAQPLIWSPELAIAARRLREGGAQPISRQRFDVGPVLTQIGYDPGPAPALAMFGPAGQSLPAAYAACLLNVIGFNQSKNGSIEQYAGQEAMLGHWREVGISIGGQGADRRVVIVLADGLAKRCIGGVVFADSDNDLRHDVGEGRPGITVRCGGQQTLTGPAGAWSLRVDSVEAGEVRFEAAGATSVRALTASPRNALLSWRLPDAKDVAVATRMIAEAQAAGLSSEQRRLRLAALLAGTLMAALDDTLAAQVETLTAPLRDEFEATRGRIMSALDEDATVLRAACVAARKPWGGAMSSWFGEAERLGRMRASVVAALAAPEAVRAKPVGVARAEVTKARAACQDPVFLAQYDTWIAQLVAAQPAEPSTTAKPEKPEKPEKR